MNLFKEYDDSHTKMSRWLPWACQVSRGVVENKDGSFVGAFSYGKVNTEDTELRRIVDIFEELLPGWTWWNERQSAPEGVKKYIAIAWSPKPQSRNQAKDKRGENAAYFQSALDRIAAFLRQYMVVEQLAELELLQFLHDTITPGGGKIPKPKLPLYLDALLSQQNWYGINEQGLRVNDQNVQAVSLLGVNNALEALWAFLEESAFAYRFARRFIVLDLETAQKEEKRYMQGWCAGRKSVLPALAYAMRPEKLRGYLTSTLILWHPSTLALALQADVVRAHLADHGILSIIETDNLADVWMGTLPAMFRCNVAPPLFELDDAASLVL